MDKSKIGNFFKFLILLVNGLALILILGRNHYLLGTALIVSRWLLFISGLILILWARKKESSKFLTITLLFSLFLIPVEYLYNKLNQEKLEETVHTQTISLLNYNVYFKNSKPLSIVEKIKKASPDVLCFQELTPKINEQLLKAFSITYPYRITHLLNGTHGIGTYSKYPITEAIELHNKRGLPYAQLMKLNFKGKKIGLINVHLTSPAVALENPDRFFSLLKTNYSLRTEQLEEINAQVKIRYPETSVIMTGDLNTTKYEPLYRDISSDWVNINSETSNSEQTTFPNSNTRKPLITIDYIWLKGKLQGLESKVLKGGHSDHLAIQGIIGLE